MQPKYVPINQEQHKHLKIKPTGNFDHASDDHLIPVNVREFVSAATEFPIVFVKDTGTGEFVATLVMGLVEKENLFCSASKWQSSYVPQVLQNYPFSVALPSADSDEVVVMLDESSEQVNALEGESLFNEDCTESDFLKQRAKAVVNYIEETNLTKGFLKMLVELDLIVAQDLTVNKVDNSTQRINGIYLVDEKKLNELSDEIFSKLRENGSLPAIYAHLLSIRQISRVARKKFEADG
jgi:hypothetical protein